MTDMRKVLFYTIFFGLQLAIFLFLGEFAVRWLHPQKTYSDLKKMVGNYYEQSPFNYLRLKPNYRGTEPSQEYPGKDVNIAINSSGLRGDDITEEKASGTKRILILGDSYTFGVYVNNDETYAAVLGRELRKDGYAVEVLNAGYADGFETDQEYTWLVNEGLKFKPDVVIYGFFVGNDITGIKPVNWRQTDGQGLPMSYQDPDLYIDENGRIRSKKADNKTVGAEAVYRIPVLRESQLCIAVANKLELLIDKIKERLTNKTSSPPGSSVVFYPQLFGESAGRFYAKYYSKSPQQMLEDYSKQEEIFKKIVVAMKDESRKNSAEFILAMIPFNFQVEPEYFMPLIFKDSEEASAIKSGEVRLKDDYFESLKPYFDSQQVRYVDILKLMREKPGRYYPRNGEVHLNPDGHRFMAEQLKDYIERNLWPLTK